MNDLINLIELWCLDNNYPYSRREYEGATVLAIKQADGLLITVEGNTLAINDHLGYACNPSMIKKNDRMEKIEYLDYHDPSTFTKMKELIEGNIQYGVIRLK